MSTKTKIPNIRETPEFQQLLKRKLQKSGITGSGTGIELAFLESNRNAIIGRLLELEGEENQDPNKRSTYINTNGRRVDCRLLFFQKRRDDVAAEFVGIQESAKSQGKRIPETMPADLQSRLLEAESDLAVVEAEIEALRIRLSAIEAVVQKVDNSRYHKLSVEKKGIGKIRGGLLVEVDGQKVEPDKDGVLRICDERSPYNGLPTADYFDLQKAFQADKWRMREEHEKKWRQAHPYQPIGEMPPAPVPMVPDWPAHVARPEAVSETDIAV